MSANKEIKSIIKALSNLDRQRTRYIFCLVHGKPLVHGMPHNVFRRCGKVNCKCNRGLLHGPYLALSVNKGGKKKIVMVNKPDKLTVLKEAKRYRYYQKKLVEIRKINREIDGLLERLKLLTIRDFP
jgi:hypothetical protein